MHWSLITNGVIIQWGKAISWQLINFPITFNNFCSINICDLGAESSWGFKTIYGNNLSSFYINTRTGNSTKFSANCFYIATGV